MKEEELAKSRRRKRKGKVYQAEKATNPASAEWFCRRAKLTIGGAWAVKELTGRSAAFGGRFGRFQMYWCKWRLETEGHLGILDKIISWIQKPVCQEAQVKSQGFSVDWFPVVNLSLIILCYNLE